MKELIRFLFNDIHSLRRYSIAEISAVAIAWSAVSILAYELLRYIF